MIDPIDIEKENKEILNKYRKLLRACSEKIDSTGKKEIRKAFNLAVDAHKNMRRKSGEPFIYHPLAVAHIAAKEVGLGKTSIICALLHDVVEDTDYTLDDINNVFGKKTTKIIDGLTKIQEVFDKNVSLQAENFRKMLLTLSDDVRVILIKLCDRLHNMRTLDSMPKAKQLKIASETLYLYAPLAHRLGLYPMKTELEDLGLKFTKSEVYKAIAEKLQETKEERRKYILKFSKPIKLKLNEQNINFSIKGRPKSIFSIRNKIVNKGVDFDNVFDKFAVRIVVDTNLEKEKSDLIREMNYSLKDKNLYFRHIPDYKSLATIQVLLNDWREGTNADIRRMALYESKVVNYLLQEKADVDISSEENNSVDPLVVKIMSEKMNEKYGKRFNKDQREILKVYAFASSEQTESSHKKLAETMKTISDRALSGIAHLRETSDNKVIQEKISNVENRIIQESTRDIDDKKVIRFLTLMDLCKEIKESQNV